jgi:signal peptidase I
MNLSGKLPLIAAVVAFAWAGLYVFAAIDGPVVLLMFAVLPLAAGIGILRRRAWAAYGLALYLATSLLLMPVLLMRADRLTGVTLEIAISAALSTLLLLTSAVLFFLAGRSLAATGAQRGWATPWIAISVLSTTLLVCAQAFVIPTGAMEETLLIGDHILVQRFPAPSVVRGGIVVFIYPVDRKQSFVKRVVGLPGDRIRVSDKILYRNGEALDEPYVTHKSSYTDPYQDNFPSEPNLPIADYPQDILENHVVNGEVVVPENSYFVLGDNRDMSLDSRYWGFVSSNDVIGAPLLIYHSEETPPGVDEHGEPTEPSRIRWERLFKIL